MALTKLDLKAIRELLRYEVNEALEEKLAAFELKFDIKLDRKLEEKLEQKLEEKLGRYPTKDEFYTAMDKLMKELETMRQELTLTPSHADFEEIHPGGKHLPLQLP